MKIMMAHNYYASTAPSGEDVVFRDELTLLRDSGIEPVCYVKRSDIRGVMTGYVPAWRSMVHGEHIARCAHCSLQSKWMLCTFITSIPSYHLWPIGLVATRAWQWCRRCITFECFAPTECCWIDAECVSLVCTTSNLSAQWSKDVTAILESQACLWPSCNIASNGAGQRMSIYSSPLRILPEKNT